MTGKRKGDFGTRAAGGTRPGRDYALARCAGAGRDAACHYRQKSEKDGPKSRILARAARADLWEAERAKARAERALEALSAFRGCQDAEADRKTRQRAIMAKATPAQRLQFSGLPFAMVVTGFRRFAKDVKIIYSPDIEAGKGGGPRKPITERTKKTRHALSFLVANSPTVARGMLTLTWPDVETDGLEVKRCLRAFCDQLRKRFKLALEWIWWLEFQRRGAPHVHILTAGAIHDRTPTRTVGIGNRQREIYTGENPDWMWRRWLAILGHEHNDRAIRFSRGGIWEKILKPDGAARYVAKDAWKPHQTIVPPAYSNVGAWWHRSRGWLKPEPSEEFFGDDSEVRKALGLALSDPLFPVLFNHEKR